MDSTHSLIDDFHVMYVLPDQKNSVLLDAVCARLTERSLPVLLIITQQRVQAFSRPDDFLAFKHMKRRFDISISFVITHSETLKTWAERSGFAVYPTEEAFSQSLEESLSPVSSPTYLPSSTKPLEESAFHDAPNTDEPAHTLLSEQEDAAGMGIEDFFVTHSSPLAPLPSPLPESDAVPASHTSPVFSSSQEGNEKREKTPHSPSASTHVTGDVTTKQRQRASTQTASSHTRLPSATKRHTTGLLDASLSKESAKISEKRNQEQSSSPSQARAKIQRFRVPIAVLLILLVLGSAGGIAAFGQQKSGSVSFLSSVTHGGRYAQTGSSVGSVSFQSSEQIGQDGTQGLNDGVVINLHSLTEPVSGKSYHAWLLNDKSQPEADAFYIGTLNVQNGNAHLVYENPQHTNLLTFTSRFLITEDDTNKVPSLPFDQSTWRYSGELSSTPNPNDTKNHYSPLDHVRHLLADDPKLDTLGLRGGLSTWFQRNVSQMVMWAYNARDAWTSQDINTAHQQLVRVLDVIDGGEQVQTDVSNTAFLIDQTQYHAGLLEFNPMRDDPPGFIYHMELHLTSLSTMRGATAEQHSLSFQIMKALNQVQYWMQQAHDLAKQLYAMNNTQLLSPAAHTMLNDLVTAVNNAYTGTIDPATGASSGGALWISAAIQRLATMNITRV